MEVGFSQRDLVCDEEMDEAELQNEDDLLEDEPPKKLVRTGCKAPRASWNPYQPHQDEYDDVVGEQPDLADYFQQWSIPEKDIILMCRSYASYLQHKSKASPK